MSSASTSHAVGQDFTPCAEGYHFSAFHYSSKWGCNYNKYYNVEYRDGTKSKGDKIGMPCTHSTVIYNTCNS